MTQKRNILMVLTTILLLSVSHAIAMPGPQNPADRIVKVLNLSEEQAALVQEVFDNAFAACEDAESREEHHSCMEAQRENVHTELATILTEEQLQTLEEQRPDNKDMERCNRRKKRSRDSSRKGER